MEWTIEQLAALNAPLDPKRVSQRTQAGRSLDYLEGWDVIAKANEIFGYGGWMVVVLETKLIGTEECTNPNNGKKGHRVAYLSHVRVVVGDSIFEDVGFGNDTSYSSALDGHELAAKESVTDGMKRCLRNYGNQFGLPLYDKQKRGVEDVPKQRQGPKDEGIKEQVMTPAPTGKREPPAQPADLEAATDDAINKFYAYLVDHGMDATKAGQQLEATRAKYNGIIPAAWLEHTFAQARLKYGDKVDV